MARFRTSDEPSEILPWLYLGPLTDYPVDDFNGHVLFVNAARDAAMPQHDRHLVLNLNWEDTLRCRITKRLESAVPIVYAFVKEHWPNVRVVVHCHAGVSRSAAFLIAFFVYAFGMQTHEAAMFISKRRPCIFPNPSFQQQMAEVTSKWLETRAFEPEARAWLAERTEETPPPGEFDSLC